MSTMREQIRAAIQDGFDRNRTRRQCWKPFQEVVAEANDVVRGYIGRPPTRQITINFHKDVAIVTVGSSNLLLHLNAENVVSCRGKDTPFTPQQLCDFITQCLRRGETLDEMYAALSEDK